MSPRDQPTAYGPGSLASATHSLILVGHAVRALTAVETPPRVAELGQALGYWAGRYQPMPGTANPAGRLTEAQALDAVPRVPDQSGGVSARITQLAHTSGWTGATHPPQEPVAADPDGALACGCRDHRRIRAGAKVVRPACEARGVTRGSRATGAGEWRRARHHVHRDGPSRRAARPCRGSRRSGSRIADHPDGQLSRPRRSPAWRGQARWGPLPPACVCRMARSRSWSTAAAASSAA